LDADGIRGDDEIGIIIRIRGGSFLDGWVGIALPVLLGMAWI
jgi:hypothetical protein